MKSKNMILADFNHPTVKNKANELIQGHSSLYDMVNAIFHYVRDNIKFAFPKEGDFVKASKTINYGYGQCNTKTTLFLALCKAVGISARIHFSLIQKEIQKGLFTSLAFWLMPKELSHSWIEIEVKGKWIKIDSYINDAQFYKGAKNKLEEKGWTVGYSVARSKNGSNIDLDFDNKKFIQMDAVTEDHGIYDEPMDYYNSSKYKNRPNKIKLFVYRLLVRSINKKVEEIRYLC